MPIGSSALKTSQLPKSNKTKDNSKKTNLAAQKNCEVCKFSEIIPVYKKLYCLRQQSPTAKRENKQKTLPTTVQTL